MRLKATEWTVSLTAKEMAKWGSRREHGDEGEPCAIVIRLYGDGEYVATRDMCHDVLYLDGWWYDTGRMRVCTAQGFPTFDACLKAVCSPQRYNGETG